MSSPFEFSGATRIDMTNPNTTELKETFSLVFEHRDVVGFEALLQKQRTECEMDDVWTLLTDFDFDESRLDLLRIHFRYHNKHFIRCTDSIYAFLIGTSDLRHFDVAVETGVPMDFTHHWCPNGFLGDLLESIEHEGDTPEVDLLRHVMRPEIYAKIDFGEDIPGEPPKYSRAHKLLAEHDRIWNAATPANPKVVSKM